ncbi:fanconi-associated nuclease 1-like [Microplitis mediator]|uniref:fanconi-associated nuclease 1-like n=1 Tax=Microplitis mediator TaxID=375433 RepID=UPI00255443C4|nr:fanconi-associated nuclease 1-like [Microplitis mediator]XP_057322350.1 fanconi-associated nuclease 1-like [Microplitis mediator]
MRQTELSEFFKITGSPGSYKRDTKRKYGNLTPKSTKKFQIKVTPKKSSSPSKMEDKKRSGVSLSQVQKKLRLDDPEDSESDSVNLTQPYVPMDFDLEKIYREKHFDIEFGSVVMSMCEEVKRLRPSENKHVQQLFSAVYNTLTLPINCAYFNEEELNVIRSMLSLTDDAKILLARLLKWKDSWHRVKKISGQLEIEFTSASFQELVDKGIFDCDYETDQMSVVLDLLLVDELKSICKRMKVPHTTGKPKMITELLKIDSKKKSMFVGMKTPSAALKKVIEETVGPCVRVSVQTWDLIKRILTLLYPVQAADEPLAAVFHILDEVHYENRVYPEVPLERYPIFRNRQSLIEFVEAKSALIKITDLVTKKHWDLVRELGLLGFTKLEPVFNSVSVPELPSHVRRFDATYVWAKVVWTSIDAFKKEKTEGMPTATKFLRALIANKKIIQGRIGRWYSELALIEMSHNKDLEASVTLTHQALTQERLSLVDTAEMLDRARKLVARKTGISNESKELMKQLIQDREEEFVVVFNEVVVTATMMPHEISTGTKSVWRVKDDLDTELMRVEMVAMRHYKSDGFSRGLHCEGKLPVTLFACLFWEEIYTISVPGAFVCPYQVAPLDLYGSQFYPNRREAIDDKLNFAGNLDDESLADVMHDNFLSYREYFSLISNSLVEDGKDFKDMVKCLGVKAVTGICGLMVKNYCQWSAGFPDLIVWNPDKKKCKVVEVKGPGDSLSMKQKLWIKNLMALGVKTEVCLVKAK